MNFDAVIQETKLKVIKKVNKRLKCVKFPELTIDIKISYINNMYKKMKKLLTRIYKTSNFVCYSVKLDFYYALLYS